MGETRPVQAELFEEFVADLKAAFGPDLISVVLYGSALTADYRPGKSDINFLLVVPPATLDRLEGAWPVVRKWRKRHVAVPLVLSAAYIASSADVFPIEYLNFQLAYLVVYGSDPFEGLVLDRQLMRVQCERELKGKLLLLREAYLRSAGKTRMLAQVMREAVPALGAILQAFFHVRGEAAAQSRREVFERAGQWLGPGQGALTSALDVYEGRLRSGKGTVPDIYRGLMREVRELAVLVDRWGGEAS